MTKEILLSLSWFDERHETHTIPSKDLTEFFESNVCIPKGENCHPYHMELHKWAENPLVDLQAFNDDKGAFTLSIIDEYRLKSEPVYEYMVVDHNGIIDWMTTDEFEGNDEFRFIATGTKRERQ